MNTSETLSPIEAQRVVSVLEETLEKLTFLGSITPDVLAHREELSQLVGDEISKIIGEQRRLEQKYETLITQRANLKGLSNKTKYREVQREIQNVSHALRESTKHLCRNLKENPNVGENLMKIAAEREALQELLSETILQLKDGRFDALVNKVQADKDEQERLTDIIRREAETTAKVRELEETLKAEKIEHERDMRQKHATVKALKEELQHLKIETSLKSRCAKKESKAKTQSIQREHRHLEDRLQAELDRLQQQKAMEEMVHKQTVDFLSKQRDEMEELSEEWRRRLEEDVALKQQELDELKAERERDLEELQQLQDRFDREATEAAARAEDMRKKREALEARELQEAREKVAATLLQRGLGRAYPVWKEIEGSKKGKKGKKGKGKGKKK